MERRDFIKTGLVTAAAPTLILADIETIKRSRKPMAISTWNHGINANEEAMKVLLSEGSALDAVEAGVKISEADPAIQSVGFGGRPDGDGLGLALSAGELYVSRVHFAPNRKFDSKQGS